MSVDLFDTINNLIDYRSLLNVNTLVVHQATTAAWTFHPYTIVISMGN
jgi:hypothetical protein